MTTAITIQDIKPKTGLPYISVKVAKSEICFAYNASVTRTMQLASARDYAHRAVAGNKNLKLKELL